MAGTTYTSATLAEKLATTPRELRKFLRSDMSGVSKVGKGGRYSLDFTAPQVKALTKKFNEWTAAGEAARAQRAADNAAKALNVLTIALAAKTDEEVAEIEAAAEAFADAEFDPTDEDIAELETFDADFEDTDEV